MRGQRNPDAKAGREQDLGELDRRAVCNNALNEVKADWDSRTQAANYVAEAKNRDLSVDDCRLAIGLASLSSSSRTAIATQAKKSEATFCFLAVAKRDCSAPGLCNLALNTAKDDWDKGGYVQYIDEVRRRSLRVG